MSGYKVKILKPNTWRSHPVARLDISVGALNHEGERLESTLLWCVPKFSHIIVSVADTLQRHNMMAEGRALAESTEKSRSAGAEWLERNKKLLQIMPSFTVKRWDDRLLHPLYPQYLQKTLSTYEKDPLIQEAALSEAKSYLERRSAAHEMSSHRINYLIEELAVFDLLFNTEPAADIYPGSMLPFWDMDPWIDRARFTRIDFVRRKAA